MMYIPYYEILFYTPVFLRSRDDSRALHRTTTRRTATFAGPRPHIVPIRCGFLFSCSNPPAPEKDEENLEN